MYIRAVVRRVFELLVPEGDLATELACIICNWDNGIWGPLFAGAALAIGLATVAAGGFFGGGTAAGGPNDGDGGDVTPPDPQQYWLPPGGYWISATTFLPSPPYPMYSDFDRYYWPGLSPYPKNGWVFENATGRLVPVNALGEPMPDQAFGDARMTASQSSAARG